MIPKMKKLETTEISEQELNVNMKEPDCDLFFLVPKNVLYPDGAKKVDVSLLAIYIKRQFTIRRYNEQIKILKNNYYQNVDNMKSMISSQIPEMYRIPKNIEDCEKLLRYDGDLVITDEDLAPENYIAFENGVLNLITMEFIDYCSPAAEKLIFINQVGYRWNPEVVKDQKTDDFFDNMTEGKQEDIDFLFQVLGTAMSSYRDFKNFFYFTGPKDTGKSQYLHLIEQLLTNSDGVRDYSSIGIKMLTDEQSKEIIPIIGKRANICGETPDMSIKSDTLLKQLTGGDMITLYRKFNEPKQIKNKAILIFAGNTVPKFFVSDQSSLSERLLIYRFKTAIPKEKQIPSVCKTLNMEYVIVKAVEQLLKLIKDNQHFTIPEEIYANKEKMEKESDSIYRFYRECVVYTHENSHRISSYDLYAAYQYYLMEEEGILNNPYCDKPNLKKLGKVRQRTFITKMKTFIGEGFHSRRITYYDSTKADCFVGIQLQNVQVLRDEQGYKIKLLK